MSPEAVRRGPGTRLWRAVFRLERRALAWPAPVGLARVLGLLGIAAVVVDLLTWQMTGGSETSVPRAIVLVIVALGSVALLVAPAAAFTPATSHAAVGAAIALQTAYAIETRAIASPYLTGYVAIILAVALFAPRRMAAVAVAVTLAGLAVVTLADLDPTGSDIATALTEGTVCILVGVTTTLLASHERRNLEKTERRLRRVRQEIGLRRSEALSDPLTGLRNRRAFDADLASALADRRRAGRLLLVMADADRLKLVNDTLGHAAGDLLLQVLADALRANVRSGDRVYRIGGDEFAVLASCTDPEAAIARFGDHVGAVAPVAGSVRASLGIACAEPDDDPAALIARADAALYETKRRRPAVA